MQDIQVSPAQARAAMRALAMVARASHGVDASEAALLKAAAAALRVDEPLDALAPIEPDEIAAVLPTERDRTRLVEAMMLTAIVDQEVDGAELAVIDRFAKAFGIDEPRLRNLHQFVDGHHARMKLDVMRRSYFTEHVIAEAWKAEGLKGVWKAVGPRWGFAKDPELAWRYKQLGLLPEGTLGREYWAHCTSRRFSFPGEEHGFPWQVVHDMGHLLGGHDTDPAGEIEQAAFEAGYMKRDPFFLLFSVTMIFHLGFPVLGDDYIGTARGKLDPAAAIDAYQRGLACKVDVTEWDYWPHVARPLDDVRRELGVVAKGR
jgi:uncharacterized tellurite resistance protein B-like protein